MLFSLDLLSPLVITYPTAGCLISNRLVKLVVVEGMVIVVGVVVVVLDTVVVVVMSEKQNSPETESISKEILNSLITFHFSFQCLSNQKKPPPKVVAL